MFKRSYVLPIYVLGLGAIVSPIVVWQYASNNSTMEQVNEVGNISLSADHYRQLSPEELEALVVTKWEQQDYTDLFTLAHHSFHVNQYSPSGYKLGAMYKSGKGVDKDLLKAYHYFDHPFVREGRWAKFNMGIILLDKNFEGYDPELARKYLTEASDAGLSQADELL